MEFWLDEKIGSLPPEARLLYIGTWSLADDIDEMEDVEWEDTLRCPRWHSC